MSWNKNTVNYSRISAVIEIMDILKYPYRLENTKEVLDYGLNDDGPIQLKSLSFTDTENQNYIIVEKIFRTSDCDFDDSIESITMKLEEYNPDTFVYDYSEEE
jgi:hypothetical protein